MSATSLKLDDHGSIENIEIPADLANLIPGFLNRREQDVTDLTASIAKSDFTTIGHIGHKLHGNGSGFGFAIISQIGADLEIAAKNCNMVLIREETLHLYEIVHELKKRLIK